MTGTQLGTVGLLVVFPVLAAIAGAVLAALRPPGPRLTSGVQHFAAGAVLASAGSHDRHEGRTGPAAAVSRPGRWRHRGGRRARFRPPALLAGLLAFGVAALLFLATEELLVEAHETVDTPLLAAMFFVGFFALYIVDAGH